MIAQIDTGAVKITYIHTGTKICEPSTKPHNVTNIMLTLSKVFCD